VLRTLAWRRLDSATTEYFGLWSDGSGWQLRGTVVGALDGRPFRVRYGVILDELWRTRAVHIALRAACPEEALQLSVDESQRWWTGKAEVRALRDCIDVDLALSPSTATIPIRRLELDVGRSVEIVSAVVRFPELTGEPARQRYTRLGQTRYRFESETFSTDLEVDELGLVMTYPGGWIREAAEDVH
jgi:hypothetical protein